MGMPPPLSSSVQLAVRALRVAAAHIHWHNAFLQRTLRAASTVCKLPSLISQQCEQPAWETRV
jgi:hypothetical protein